jgi:hypothetical protein
MRVFTVTIVARVVTVNDASPQIALNIATDLLENMGRASSNGALKLGFITECKPAVPDDRL